jgi:Biotin-requiring enzyme
VLTARADVRILCLCSIFRVSDTRIVLHATSRRGDITQFQMPAMSPTMTEGGISEWKKSEGEAFAAGDVLLEIVSVSHICGSGCI